MSSKIQLSETDKIRAAEVLRVTWIGFWLNLILSALKIVAGWLGNSRAVMADGVHSLSDLITDIAVLIGVRFWLAPPDGEHPYGHKRLESLVSLSIGLLLAVAGIGIACNAVIRLIQTLEQPLNQTGSWHTGSLIALLAALLSIGVKEWLYRWTNAKGREMRSEALRANAWHHRSDAFSSIPIAIAVFLTIWFPGLTWLDPAGAFIVGLFILHASWKICADAAGALLDRGADPATLKRIRDFVKTVEGVRGVHDLRTRYMGQGLSLDLHVCVDGNMTVAAGNVIAHAVERACYTSEACRTIGLEISDVLVHIDPWRPFQDQTLEPSGEPDIPKADDAAAASPDDRNSAKDSAKSTI